MPIFEYQCPECSKCYEFIHKYKDSLEGQAVCEECNKELQRVVSVSGFRLLGGGWEPGKPMQDWD